MDINLGKPTLVFLHGWSQNPEYFTIMSYLFESNKYRVVYPILPGFGKSKILKPYTLEDYSTWLKTYISKIKSKSIYLIGHSFGGSVAVKYLSETVNPRVKLILVDPAIVRSKDNLPRKILKIILLTLRPVIQIPTIKRFLLKSFNLDESDYQKIPNQIMKDTFRNIIHQDLRKLLPNIKNKTLLVWGESDESTPFKYAPIVRNMIPDCRLVVMRNAGHFPFNDNQSQFKNIIENYINENK